MAKFQCRSHGRLSKPLINQPQQLIQVPCPTPNLKFITPPRQMSRVTYLPCDPVFFDPRPWDVTTDGRAGRRPDNPGRGA